MKKTIKMGLLATGLMLTMGLTSCTKGDGDLQKEIETALKAMPETAGTMVTVKDGIATITGECKDEACKTKCAEIVKKIAGVKEVVDQCTVASVVESVESNVTELPFEELAKAVSAVTTSYPMLNTSLMDGGTLIVYGEIAKDKAEEMKTRLDSLKSVGIKEIKYKNLVEK